MKDVLDKLAAKVYNSSRGGKDVFLRVHPWERLCPFFVFGTAPGQKSPGDGPCILYRYIPRSPLGPGDAGKLN